MPIPESPPGLYCVCRNENTKGAERQLKYLVYNLEAACRAADEAGWMPLACNAFQSHIYRDL